MSDNIFIKLFKLKCKYYLNRVKNGDCQLLEQLNSNNNTVKTDKSIKLGDVQTWLSSCLGFSSMKNLNDSLKVPEYIKSDPKITQLQIYIKRSKKVLIEKITVSHLRKILTWQQGVKLLDTNDYLVDTDDTESGVRLKYDLIEAALQSQDYYMSELVSLMYSSSPSQPFKLVTINIKTRQIINAIEL